MAIRLPQVFKITVSVIHLGNCFRNPSPTKQTLSMKQRITGYSVFPRFLWLSVFPRFLSFSRRVAPALHWSGNRHYQWNKEPLEKYSGFPRFLSLSVLRLGWSKKLLQKNLFFVTILLPPSLESSKFRKLLFPQASLSPTRSGPRKGCRVFRRR